MDRREFVRVAATSSASAAVGASALLTGCGARRAGALYRPPIVSPEGLQLTARHAIAEIAPGIDSPILTWGDGPVGPTIEARRGRRATITMRNELREPTIAHWHGLRPPEHSDGHPRLQVGPGETYGYDFEVAERAGLYWYHSHAHELTGRQVYLGLAGLFIVRDEAEATLGLPTGERELALVLQDKRQDRSGTLVYDPRGPQLMEGFLGDSPFVNGTRFPRVDVDSAPYRLRLLGASNARIFRIGLSNGAPLVLIGGEVGLLDAPVQVPHVDVATGERADLVVDFSGLPEGTTIRLQSLAFPSPSRGMGMMGRGRMGAAVPQGAAIDLLEFVVTRAVRERHRLPAALIAVERLDPAAAERERVFHFDSMMMRHTINGRAFEGADRRAGCVRRRRAMALREHRTVPASGAHACRAPSGAEPHRGPRARAAVGARLKGHRARAAGGGGRGDHRRRQPSRAIPPALPQARARGHGHDDELRDRVTRAQTRARPRSSSWRTRSVRASGENGFAMNCSPLGNS